MEKNKDRVMKSLYHHIEIELKSFSERPRSHVRSAKPNLIDNRVKLSIIILRRHE